MDPLFNTGLDAYWWFTIFKIILLVGLFLKFLGSVISYIKSMKGQEISFENQTKKSNVKKLVKPSIWLLVFILSWVFLFFSYGPGKDVTVTEESEFGMTELIKEMPEEKTQEVIDSISYDKKSEFLKRQDSSSVKETQEADEAIRKAIEEADKYQKSHK